VWPSRTRSTAPLPPRITGDPRPLTYQLQQS